MRRPRLRVAPSVPKFALFAVVCLVLLVALAAKIGNLTLFSSRYALVAEMSDVTGLTSGSPVDIAGVPVGQVGSIGVRHGYAVVTLDVNHSVQLHAGTDVGMRWQNVLGQKEIYLYPDSRGPMLGAGSTIPLSHDVSDASVDQFLNAFGPFLTAIDPHQANEFVENVSGALEGDTAQINQLLDNGARVASTVGSLDTQVGRVIDDLDTVLTAVAQRSTDVTSLVDNLNTVAAALSSHNQVLDAVVGNLSSVAGDLAGLVGNNRSQLDSTIDDLDQVAATIASHQQELSNTLSTAGAGLAPYQEISSFGQWFQVQQVYTCLANQSVCTYYEPLNAPSGSGPGGGPPLSVPSGLTPATSSTSSSSSTATTPTSAATSGLAPLLQVLSGAPAAPSVSTTGSGQ